MLNVDHSFRFSGKSHSFKAAVITAICSALMLHSEYVRSAQKSFGRKGRQVRGQVDIEQMIRWLFHALANN